MRIAQRYDGNSGVRTVPCAEQFRTMGFRPAVRRSTLAGANEGRDWRIWADLAAVLIRRAQALRERAARVELDNTVYALDSSTIDLCLSLFEWAPFRSTKAAIKLHTLLDLGPCPTS